MGALENQPENSMKDKENVEVRSNLGYDNVCSGQEELSEQLRELSSQEVLCSTKVLNCRMLLS